jgi:hypothetical protein
VYWAKLCRDGKHPETDPPTLAPEDTDPDQLARIIGEFTFVNQWIVRAAMRGGIDWRGKGKRRATPVSWARFADLMSGADARVGPPTPTKARRPVKQPAPVADQKTIRMWAQETGMPVNARGRLPKTLTDAYYAAHS